MDDARDQARAVLLTPNSLVKAVASGRAPGRQPRWRKVEMRPVELAAGPRLQVTTYSATQAFTANHEWAAAAEVVEGLWSEGFATWTIDSREERVRVRTGKGGRESLTRSPREAPLEASGQHDRIKERMLPLDSSVLHRLGITTAAGAVKPSRHDKLRQVDEFLRLLWPALEGAGLLGLDRPVRIVDLGCGNAYLTFAAHALLSARGIDSRVVGIDIKEQSRDHNSAVARDVGVEADVTFVASSIADAPAAVDGAAPDVVMALHACDTATDDAIAVGVRSGASLVLAAPCCHHDIQSQLTARGTSVPYPAIVRHGILRERWGDVLTDSLRAEILALLGFRVDVVEFIGSQHTPRNALIRASRTGVPADRARWEAYDTLVADWGVTPVLAEVLAPEMGLARAEVDACG